MHRQSRCDIIYNNKVTHDFEVKSGVHQGSPLSPLLFIILMEPVIKWISNSTQGYNFARNPSLTIKILAYVDDVILISQSRSDLDIMKNKFEAFLSYYGIKINSKKSTYAYMNSNVKHSPPEFNGQPVVKRGQAWSYKYLGTWINLDLKWDKQCSILQDSVSKLLKSIKRKAITTDQKIKYVNTLINSKLAYHMDNIDFPDEWIKEIEDNILDAIRTSLPIERTMSKEFLWLKEIDEGRQLLNLQDVRSSGVIGSWYDYLTTTHKLCKATTEQRLKDLQVKLSKPMMQFTSNMSDTII